LVQVAVQVELPLNALRMVVMVEIQECIEQTLVQRYLDGVLVVEVAVADLLVLVEVVVDRAVVV
jgi:hypothetical protein